MEEDYFGDKLLSGAAAYLESVVRDEIGVKVRSFDLGLAQRSASQSLSRADVEEAALAGEFAVAQAVSGQTGQMVTFQRETGAEYRLRCELAAVDRICNQEKMVPRQWLTTEGTDVREEFLSYLRPLIQGEIWPPAEDGLPKFLVRK